VDGLSMNIPAGRVTAQGYFIWERK